MSLNLFIDKLPEDVRETYKAEIGKYVPVENREMAKALLTSNPHFNAEFQAALSLKHEDSMKKFQSEKLPGMIEEEIKKRGTKQPWEIEIENLRKEAAEKDKLLLLRERKSQAIAELSKHGLDADLADFVLDADEETFKSKINTLTGKVISWRDSAIKSEKEKIFSTPNPKGGNDPSAKILPREQFNALTPEKQRAFISEGGKLE